MGDPFKISLLELIKQIFPMTLAETESWRKTSSPVLLVYSVVLLPAAKSEGLESLTENGG